MRQLNDLLVECQRRVVTVFIRASLILKRVILFHNLLKKSCRRLSRSIESAIKHANADFNYHQASLTCKIRAKEEVGKHYLLFASSRRFWCRKNWLYMYSVCARNYLICGCVLEEGLRNKVKRWERKGPHSKFYRWSSFSGIPEQSSTSYYHINVHIQRSYQALL